MASIHSMTAFARESEASGAALITVEIRTVNHRYLDCNFKLPDALRALEPRLREQAGKALARGKLDCLFRVQSHARQADDIRVNAGQLQQLLQAVEQVREAIPDTRAPTPLEVLQYPGICEAPEQSEEELQKAAAALFERALASLAGNRAREGEKMAALVRDRLEQVEAQVAVTREMLPALRQQQHDKIVGRIEELDIEIDHNRLEQELVHLAQKADVDEELDRLEAHVGEVRRTLEKAGPCGRRLDFLMQELNREANTLSSKSVSSGTTQNAVELKVLIEQMREQIQNIE